MVSRRVGRVGWAEMGVWRWGTVKGALAIVNHMILEKGFEFHIHAGQVKVFGVVTAINIQNVWSAEKGGPKTLVMCLPCLKRWDIEENSGSLTIRSWWSCQPTYTSASAMDESNFNQFLRAWKKICLVSMSSPGKASGFKVYFPADSPVFFFM